MEHRITDAAETLKLIRERLNSKEWWIWIPIGFTGASTLQKIEKAFYWNEANKDFDLAFFPARMLFVAMGRKSRCTPKQIQNLVAVSVTENIQITDETDVMILVADDDEAGKAHAIGGLLFIAAARIIIPELN